MLAATSDATGKGKAYTYIADQEAVGSAFVVYDGQQYTVTGQLDSGLLMATSKDPIALLALKPQDELNHQDLATCILWSSIAGQALVRAGVPRAQVRVPFLIGSGLHVSLFVTEFSDDDEFCPTARCMLDRLTLQSQKNAKKVFVALKLLLGQLKIEIGKLPDDGERILRERRKSKEVISRNVLSKRLKCDDVPTARANASDRRELEETHETDDATENETMAMEAVMKFCPETLHLAHPWARYRSIFGGDGAQFYQQSSPFFFRGGSSPSPVFYKVWRQGDDYVDEGSIGREVSLLRHAFRCEVSVPSVLKYGELQSANDIFFVLQMSDVGDHHFVNTRDELLVYAISLIGNVLKLHSKANILHCDLKPQHVIWNGTEAILLDFGHAQIIGEVSPIPGTTGFEAPEVEQGQANTHSTDAFSVGKLLLTAIDRFTEKDESLQSVAHGLCMPEWQSRLSLQDAYRKLKEHQKDQVRPASKKAKIFETKNGCGGESLSIGEDSSH
jgi:serine/threonine protein kinase